mmetsp:Transcript_24374/g.44135  ORF Transcript_24374/g.44135 Transcript_24374/m.44135 type:complete len:596 (-) Transcript_24374:31-1818(-)
MGRAADPSDEEASADDSDEEDADEESARKRRKVVLVRAKAAKSAERGAEADAGTAEAPKVRSRPNSANSATGRILQWLGHSKRAERPAAERPPKPAAKPPAPAMAASREEVKSGLVKKKRPQEEGSPGTSPAPPQTKAIKSKVPPAKPSTEAKKATLSKRTAPVVAKKAVAAKSAGKPVAALKKAREAAATRSASPCSPEPARKTAPAKATSKRPVKGAPSRVLKSAPAAAKKAAVKTARPAKVAVQGKTNGRAADSHESDESVASPSRSSSYSRSPSPAPAPTPAPAPAATKILAKATKRPRPASPKQIAAAPPASPKATASQLVATPTRRPVLSAADEGSFQDAVHDRLQQLCGENEDAKVLAEYIVVMVAGSKGRDEMAVELKPFFPEQDQAESFVDWVEECKWKFLTGGPSPAITSVASPPTKSIASSPAPRSSPPADFWGPAPEAASSSTARASKEAKTRRPHVAVTSKVILQPNPNFDNSPPSSPQQAQQAQATSPAFSKAAAAVSKPAPAPVPARPAPVAAAPAVPVQPRGIKNELLDKLTKQLQLILTKLQDKTLPDETREKYQDLAKSIQTQMAKITKPAPAARRR